MINLKNVFKKTLADILRKNVFQMKNIFFSKFFKMFSWPAVLFSVLSIYILSKTVKRLATQSNQFSIKIIIS